MKLGTARPSFLRILGPNVLKIRAIRIGRLWARWGSRFPNSSRAADGPEDRHTPPRSTPAGTRPPWLSQGQAFGAPPTPPPSGYGSDDRGSREVMREKRSAGPNPHVHRRTDGLSRRIARGEIDRTEELR